MTSGPLRNGTGGSTGFQSPRHHASFAPEVTVFVIVASGGAALWHWLVIKFGHHAAVGVMILVAVVLILLVLKYRRKLDKLWTLNGYRHLFAVAWFYCEGKIADFPPRLMWGIDKFPTGVRVKFQLSHGLTLSDIEGVTERLASSLGASQVTVHCGDRADRIYIEVQMRAVFSGPVTELPEW
ncbi:hypothetical protein [Ferrimicrobium sp.]|uniref:hypothetical protein n=1 Tax=Ferrimicrobium sp. TaxID=2926050 RepID=UPI00260C8756|nr:hypothetical protein [Ferrimicrobium sp.]